MSNVLNIILCSLFCPLFFLWSWYRIFKIIVENKIQWAVADPLLEDDSDNDDDDEEAVVVAPVVPAAAPAPPARPLAPVKQSYTTSRGGKVELKQDFLELYQTNMLAQQQERAEERRQATEERRQANQRSKQMMAMMMAIISGMTGRTDTRY